MALPALVAVQVEALPVTVRGSDGSGPVPAVTDPPQPRVGSGSGFVLSSDGYIITNNHLVAEAMSVTVVLADNRRFEASVVGRDPPTDIAVLMVEAESLQAARIGDSDELQVGDWVLALGYPLGLSLTVTAGIVSGTGRSLGIAGRAPEAVAPTDHFIQTDAAINPGSSGGPLVDLAGNVVGLTSALASPTGFYAGYGFAVPINLARRVADDLIRYGEVRRPRIGLRTSDVTPADADIYNLPDVAGAEVVGVDPEGPAAIAGVRLGDVIVALGSTPVLSAHHFRALVTRRQPGELVRLRLIRFGETVEVSLVLASFPSPERTSRPAWQHQGPAPLDFSIQETRLGVVVTAVERYGRAARAGVRDGQQILEVNRRAVRTRTEFEGGVRLAFERGSVLSLRVRDPELGETMINYEPEPHHRSTLPGGGGGKAPPR